MKNSTHSNVSSASWLALVAAFSIAALPSCSSPSSSNPSPSEVSAAGGIAPPHLANDGAGGGRVMVVNSNEHSTLRVDYIRMIPDQGTSLTSRTDVPPGASVALGSSEVNGSRCTYQLSGWTKVHSMEHVAKAKPRKAPVQERSPVLAKID